MRYTEITPSADLRRYIKCFWTLEAAKTETGSSPEPVMPDGCIELVFNFSDPFLRHHSDGVVETQPLNLVAGQIMTSALIGPSGATDLLGVRFTHAGASPFFKFPLNELTNRIIDLEAVWDGEMRYLGQRLGYMRSVAKRIELLEGIFRHMLGRAKDACPIVETAAGMIGASGGLISIEQITGAMGINERRIERRFQQKFGLSPKKFSRIVRFQNFMGAVSGSYGSILDIALAHGYYDQAHFIREFRKFSGKTPTEFFGSEHKISEAFISA